MVWCFCLVYVNFGVCVMCSIVCIGTDVLRVVVCLLCLLFVIVCVCARV